MTRVRPNFLGLRLLGIALLFALPFYSFASQPAAAASSHATTEDASTLYLPFVTRASAPPLPAGQVFHIPFSTGSASGVRLPEMAVFWFGQVTPTSNSVDVRLGFNNQSLVVDVAIIDRQLWHDNSPDAGSLTDWDAVTLYLDTAGPSGTAPRTTSYRLIGQAGSGPTNQTAARGTGASWAPASVAFTTTLGWRGDAFNSSGDDHGWWLQYEIPFASLGLAGRPADGTQWALAVVMHDRDDNAGTPIPDTLWPSALVDTQPASWGRVSYGLPTYVPPPSVPQGSVSLRHGQNGVSVPDQHAGGGTTCTEWGNDSWNAFGSQVQNGTPFVNVQNQRDVSDFPCFSRLYVTFPLAGHIPAGRAILSASLTLHLTGGSGGDAVNQPTRSLIQVLMVDNAWDPNTLNWNNAPRAVLNVSRTYVEPSPAFPGWPGIPYVWDLSYAVATAYANGQSELRLALYSSDGAIHSGKYFASSETDGFSAVSRPTLTVTWGAP